MWGSAHILCGFPAEAAAAAAAAAWAYNVGLFSIAEKGGGGGGGAAAPPESER